MPTYRAIACVDCDLLFERIPLVKNSRAMCHRCGALLYSSSRRIGITSSSFAVATASLFTFLIALAAPIVSVNLDGIQSSTTLVTAIMALFDAQMSPVATAVFFMTIACPFGELIALPASILLIRFGCPSPRIRYLTQLLRFARLWSMTDVFSIGILVTVAKLESLGSVKPAVGLFAFLALAQMIAFLARYKPISLLVDFEQTASDKIPGPSALPLLPQMLTVNVPALPLMRLAALDNSDYEDIAGALRPREAFVNNGELAEATARSMGYVSCQSCGNVEANFKLPIRTKCSLCGSWIRSRKLKSLASASALLLTAAIAYIPANVFPVLRTTSFGTSQDNTIFGGVLLFWQSGDYLFAAIIFTASIIVPTLKIVSLAFLIFTVKLRSRYRLRELTQMYRIIERVGRWSMLDVFVVTLTISIVRFRSFLNITAGLGILAFTLVVIVTMLASQAFDPRLMWDREYAKTDPDGDTKRARS